MRIISGTLKGLRLHPPGGLPVRPTTDMAKEALFNVLQNRLEFDGLRALDLFTGTGSISIELASRGAATVIAVDIHAKCLHYVKSISEKHRLAAVTTVKADVLKYLNRSQPGFGLIFADPPYDLPQLTSLPERVKESNLLLRGGLFVMEHPATRKVDHQPGFTEQRNYGQSAFSFFKYGD